MISDRKGLISIADISAEIAWCMTYDQAESCCGASGRKLRQVCVWCPKMLKEYGNKDERKKKDNVEKDS